MALNGHQVYVWEGTVKRVFELIKRYVKEVGCAAAVGFESEKPSPAMARRTQREFTLSDPRNGIISIWEDRAWGDRRLARYLSKELETRSIWLALTTMTAGGWGYVIYANGAVADSHTRIAETTEEFEKFGFEATEQCYEEAREFARRHTLPFALIYLPDPSLAACRSRSRRLSRTFSVWSRGSRDVSRSNTPSTATRCNPKT